MNEIAGIGNHNTALFGELDTRLGRRWNMDPKPTVGVSDYAVFSNSPVWKSDVLLDSAWEIKHEWNGDMTAKYQKDAPKIIESLQKGNNNFRCDDLALTTAMTFAKDNNLPFQWVTGSGTFNAASDKYKDFATFKQDVLSHSGAPDFQRNSNAFPVGKHNLFAGGVILLDRKNNGVAHHVQVVVRTVSAYNVEARSRQNIAFVIKQGNFRTDLPFPRFTGSDNPKDSRYLGVPIQTGLYDLMHDEYTNYSTGTRQSPIDEKDKIEFRQFNFLNWNK